MNDITNEFVWVTLPSEQDFLKVKETLTRIGIASKKSKTLYQSCHILHKKGRYAIVHFKELFMLDGKPTNFDDADRGRRNTIIQLLSEWGLINVEDPQKIVSPLAPLSHIKIIPHKEKDQWERVAKYTIGSRN